MPELSPEILQRIREHRPNPPSSRPSFPWLPLLLFFGAIAAGGWIYYQHWLYRLPQERVFTGVDGKSFRATLMAHNDKYLKIIRPDAGPARYLPIASLSPSDQEFIQHTKSELTIQYPLDYVLTDEAGHETPVQLQARNTEWVKVSNLATHAETLLPIVSLTSVDQAFVKLMPTTLTLYFPVEYSFTGPPKPGASVHLLGRTRNYLKYQEGSTGAKHFIAIAALAPADQAFLRQAPTSMPQEYPVDYPLTTPDGQVLPGLINNHNYDLVALKMPEDGSLRYFPIKRLSAESQSFLRELTGNLVFILPADCTIVNTEGQSARVRVLARGQEFLQLAGAVDGPERYLPLADLAPPDQEAFRLLPSLAVVRYPFDYTLTDLSGRTLIVKVLGRSADEVKFQLANGTEMTYALGKLSAINQEFLRLLPATIASTADGSQPGEPPEAKNLRKQIAALRAENEQLRAHSAIPTTPGAQKNQEKQKIADNEAQISLNQAKLDTLLRKAATSQTTENQRAQLVDLRSRLTNLLSADAMLQKALDSMPRDTSSIRTVQNQNFAQAAASFADQIEAQRADKQSALDSLRDQVEEACRQANACVDPKPKIPEEILALSSWKSVMRLLKEDDQLRQQIIGGPADSRDALRVSIRKNQAELTSLLKEIKATVGAYTPAASPAP